jgi:hypothetical protein
MLSTLATLIPRSLEPAYNCCTDTPLYYFRIEVSIVPGMLQVMLVFYIHKVTY